MHRFISAVLIYLMVAIPLVAPVLADEQGYGGPRRPVPQPINAATPIIPLAFADDDSTYAHGLFDGRRSATLNHSGGSWFAGGIASGMLLTIVGTLAITAISSGSDANPPDMELIRAGDMGRDYQMGFAEGYRQEAKSTNMGSALGGGLLGTAILIAAYLTIVNYNHK